MKTLLKKYLLVFGLILISFVNASNIDSGAKIAKAIQNFENYQKGLQLSDKVKEEMFQILRRNNDTINKMTHTGKFPDSIYQVIQQDFSKFNKSRADEAAELVGCTNQTQISLKGASPRTDSDYIFSNIEKGKPVTSEQIEQAIKIYNKRMNEHLGTNGVNYAKKLDTDLMANPKNVSAEEFAKIARLNNDAYARLGAATAEAKKRIYETELQKWKEGGRAGEPPKLELTPEEVEAYQDEMNDFILKKKQKITKLKKQLKKGNLSPSELSDINTDLTLAEQQQAKYRSRHNEMTHIEDSDGVLKNGEETSAKWTNERASDRSVSREGMTERQAARANKDRADVSSKMDDLLTAETNSRSLLNKARRLPKGDMAARKRFIDKAAEMAERFPPLQKMIFIDELRRVSGDDLAKSVAKKMKKLSKSSPKLSAKSFVQMLKKTESQTARKQLIKAREATLEAGNPELKTLKELEKIVSKEDGNKFVTLLLKNPNGSKLALGIIGAVGGSFLLKEMHNAWYKGGKRWELSDAAFAITEFVPGGMSYHRIASKGVDAKTVFYFVKDVLYFQPPWAWPFVLAGDVAVLSVDISEAVRVSSNQNGLIDLLVYAGEYSEDGRFVRLNLPKKNANTKRLIPQNDLLDFFFHTKIVVVPVSGLNLTYRIRDLTKVSNEVLNKNFLENDPVTQQLRLASQQQLKAISNNESLTLIEQGYGYSAEFEYVKWLTGYSTICEKSPEKWCKVFNLLKTKIVKRREFIKKNLMIPYLIRQAERKHGVWAMGYHPPKDKLAQVQKQIEALRHKSINVDLVKEVGKRAQKVATEVAKDRQTREKQNLAKGQYWQNALRTYQNIYLDMKKSTENIALKLNMPIGEIEKRILRFPWTGDYVKDAKNAKESRKRFYHDAWTAWKDTKKIKGATPIPNKLALDQKALSILASVQFRWRMVLDRLGYTEDSTNSSSEFKKKYKIALQEVEALYKEAEIFQTLVEKGAKIVHNPLHLGEQTAFAVKIIGEKLKKMQKDGVLKVTWHSPHGDFGSSGKGFSVNYATIHLLPVTVEAVVQDRRNPVMEGVLSIKIPVIIPKGAFRLTLNPAQPQSEESVRAKVEMPDRYINVYQFHYKWQGKDCRVEEDDRSHVVVTAPKSGSCKVSVVVYAENEKAKWVTLGTNAVSFTVSAKKNPEKKNKTVQKDKKKTLPPESSPKSAQKGVETTSENGAESGAGILPKEKQQHKKSKKIVKHGAGGSASGMFPAKTFNGMQISYSISGASMPKMKDTPGFTTLRHYVGRLGSGTLSVSGTARVTWSPLVTLSVRVSAGSKHMDKTYSFKGPGSQSFTLKIPIPDDAEGGGFSISMDGSYGNGEDRGLVVSGSFTENGPEGKAPKGTEDLSVKLTGPKKPVPVGKKIEITSDIRGGRFPYKYRWFGAIGSREKSSFQNTLAGSHTVTLNITDVDGHTAIGSTKVIVESPVLEVTGLPKSLFYGNTKRLHVRIKKGGQEHYSPVWQADEAGIEFDSPVGMETMATFRHKGNTGIWVYLTDKKGKLIAESQRVHTKINLPMFSLKVDKKHPYIGEKVLIKVQATPKIDDDAVSFWWEIKGAETVNAGPEINVPNQRAYSFITKNEKSVTVTVHAKAKDDGSELGKKSLTIKAQQYAISVSKPKRLDKAPWKWDPIQGKAVELPQAISVFQNAEVHVNIKPKPKGKLRYQWTVTPEGCSISAPMSKSTNLNAHEVGTYKVSVKVSDKNGAELGKGSTSFSVTVSQRDLDVVKQKSEDKQKSKKLLQEGRKLWKDGKLQQAIAKLAQAQKLADKDKVIAKTLKTMLQQKKDEDAKLNKAIGLIKKDKLKEAEKILSDASKINDKYPKYKKVLIQLLDAKKKAEEKNKQLVKLLKNAKALKDAGKLSEAVTVLKKGSKQFPTNKEIIKMLKEVQKQQRDALKKLKEGQREWKSGMLDNAVSTLKKAVKTDPSNRQIAKVLKGMQGQKEMMDSALTKVSKLIEQDKFEEATSVLKKAEHINTKYPPYVKMLKRLNQAKKKAEEKKKQLAKLLKNAKALKDAGKLSEAVTVLKKGNKQFPANTEIVKLLKEVQKQQNKALAKMAEGQALWKNGMLDNAVSTLKKAVKIDPSNKEIAKVLKGMQSQKKILDDAILKAGTLIKGKKFTDAENVLKGVEHTDSKYLPYKEMKKSLLSAKKENNRHKKELAEKIRKLKEKAKKEALKEKIRKLKEEAKKEALKEKNKKLEEETEKKALAGKIRKQKEKDKKDALAKKIRNLKKKAKREALAEKIRKLREEAVEAEKKSQKNKSNTQANQQKHQHSSTPSTNEKENGGYWKLVAVKGSVGRECTLEELGNAVYYRGTISGGEGDVTIAEMVRKRNHTHFSARGTWQRPPEVIYPDSTIKIPLSIEKIEDTNEYWRSMSIYIDRWDMECGATGGGEFGGLEIDHKSPKSVYKTIQWKEEKVLYHRKAGDKRTIRVCYGGVSICGKRGWKYYYEWVPESSKVDIPVAKLNTKDIRDAAGNANKLQEEKDRKVKLMDRIKKIRAEVARLAHGAKIKKRREEAKASYIGCYRDEGSIRDIGGYYFRSGSMTHAKCSKTCLKKGFKYAGAQYADYCFCGNSYGKYGKADNCNMPCTGNKNEICGGAWANSVYALEGADNTPASSGISGIWRWFDGETVWIYRNGTSRSSYGNRGRWSKKRNGSKYIYTINWSNGQYIDTLVLRGDTVDGHNQNGTHVWGKRISNATTR